MRFIRLSLAPGAVQPRRLHAQRAHGDLRRLDARRIPDALQLGLRRQVQDIPVDGHNISTIAFYTGGLTTYGVMLGTFTGILVGDRRRARGRDG